MRPLYAAALVSLVVTLLVLWYAKIHVERRIEQKVQGSTILSYFWK